MAEIMLSKPDLVEILWREKLKELMAQEKFGTNLGMRKNFGTNLGTEKIGRNIGVEKFG